MALKVHWPDVTPEKRCTVSSPRPVDPPTLPTILSECSPEKARSDDTVAQASTLPTHSSQPFWPQTEPRAYESKESASVGRQGSSHSSGMPLPSASRLVPKMMSRVSSTSLPLQSRPDWATSRMVGLNGQPPVVGTIQRKS